MPDTPASAFAPSDFPAGTLVRLKKEYCEPGEEKDDYKVVEDRGDRVLIEPIEWSHGPIVPQECVSAYMVEKIPPPGP